MRSHSAIDGGNRYDEGTHVDGSEGFKISPI
jgi:hypothetical protein